MIKNQNHPKKGSLIKVEPIRQKAAIERIKASLLHNGNYRDYCLFTLGINTAFRANELLSLTIDQVAHLKTGDTLGSGPINFKDCPFGLFMIHSAKGF